MTPSLFIELALTPALRLLPPEMDSAAARAMIVAVSLQESRIKHRRQIGGPARGYAQFEKGGGVLGVLTHPASKDHAREVCAALDYEPTTDAVYVAIEHNDILACCFARLLLWTHPEPLPGQNEADAAWDYYESVWRPGKPHPETWLAFWHQAWVEVWRAQKAA